MSRVPSQSHWFLCCAVDAFAVSYPARVAHWCCITRWPVAPFGAKTNLNQELKEITLLFFSIRCWYILFCEVLWISIEARGQHIDSYLLLKQNKKTYYFLSSEHLLGCSVWRATNPSAPWMSHIIHKIPPLRCICISARCLCFEQIFQSFHRHHNFFSCSL